MTTTSTDKPGRAGLIALSAGVAVISSILAVPYTLVTSFIGYIYFTAGAILIWTGLTYFGASFLIRKLNLTGRKRIKPHILLGAFIGYLSSWLTLTALSDTSGGLAAFFRERYLDGVYVSFSDFQTMKIGWASFENFSGPLLILVWLAEAAFFLILTSCNRD